MGILDRILRAGEGKKLKALARSKGIPSAVANAAKQMLKSRSGD